jgi:hypothetical protein
MSNLVLTVTERYELLDAIFEIRPILESVTHEETKRKLYELQNMLRSKVARSVDTEKYVKDLDFYIGEELCDNWHNAMENEGYEQGYKWEIPTIDDLIKISECIDNPLTYTTDEYYWSKESHCKTKASCYFFYNDDIVTVSKKHAHYYFYISRKGEPNV